MLVLGSSGTACEIENAEGVECAYRRPCRVIDRRDRRKDPCLPLMTLKYIAYTNRAGNIIRSENGLAGVVDAVNVGDDGVIGRVGAVVTIIALDLTNVPDHRIIIVAGPNSGMVAHLVPVELRLIVQAVRNARGIGVVKGPWANHIGRQIVHKSAGELPLRVLCLRNVRRVVGQKQETF